MARLSMFAQVFVHDDKTKTTKASTTKFIDKGQNWENCKCHPREIVIISGDDTPEIKALICASIRVGQGYPADKAAEDRMIFK